MAQIEKKKGVLIRRKQRLINDLQSWVWLLPAVIVLYLMIWRPTVMGGVWSLFKMKGYKPIEFIGLKNFFEVVRDTNFIPMLMNTLKYVVCSLVVGFIPPFLLAVMVNELRCFKNGMKTIIYLPAVVPGVAALLMWSYIYAPDHTGLLNMLLGAFGMEPYGWLMDEKLTILYIIVSMTWSGCAGAMLLYFSSLQSVTTVLYEAATIDGAGIFRKFRHVTIPQVGGVLLLQLIQQIISVFQVMEQPMAMTGGGPNNASISIGFQIYRYGFVNGRAGHAMALSVISFIFLLCLTAFYFKLQKKIESNL